MIPSTYPDWIRVLLGIVIISIIVMDVFAMVYGGYRITELLIKLWR